MTIEYLPIFPERPTNPARCNVRTGEIEINAARWRELSESEREFVLQHEIGHYKGQTFDEVKADQYALNQLALKKPYSLRNYLYAVNEVSYGNQERVNQAKLDVLTIAAKNGSKEAQELLSKYALAAADGGSSKGTGVNKWIVSTVVVLVLLFVVINVRKWIKS